ncbi:fibronectin type III domain-containing protein [uncultured Helicobacter sp.]|uniref:fibronectin type III domain-containing protein n=1 Tax=uncultured Helicobacter sp. TaxID=175537 RepID=UPI0026147F60|nr:fibronectin type III domain-containing protein [uncultured Helicobacter sp.]
MILNRPFSFFLGGIVSILMLAFNGCSTMINPNPSVNSSIMPPKNIRVLSDINTNAFEWDSIQDPEIAGYYIYRKQANAQNFSKIATLDSRFITHYADNKLDSNTEYVYQFASFDKQKNVSSFSQAITAKTHSISAVNYVEAISNYPRKVKIIWSPHQDTRVNGYIVERKEKNGNWKELNKIPNRLLVEYLDTKLEDGTTYEYQVIAYNANGSRSIPSKSVQATTKSKPAQITNFKATNNIPKQINLSWNLHNNPEVTSYKILRSGFISSFYTTLATLPSNTNSYQDLIDKDGEQYNYKIIATDKDGIDSLEVGPIIGSTLSVPNAPNITYAQIENGSVVLRWNPTDNRATEYIVYKKDSIFFGETLRYNKVLTTEFIDREIKAGEKYYYRVSTIDKNGLESKPSQEVVLSLPK